MPINIWGVARPWRGNANRRLSLHTHFAVSPNADANACTGSSELYVESPGQNARSHRPEVLLREAPGGFRGTSGNSLKLH